MTKFYFWLEKMLKAGEKVTELSAAAKLTALRSEQPQYVMDSFASISSYGPHGAVVHYSPTPETDTELKTDSLYLLDSGAQYLDGTTDITRTIALCDRAERANEEGLYPRPERHYRNCQMQIPRRHTGLLDRRLRP